VGTTSPPTLAGRAAHDAMRRGVGAYWPARDFLRVHGPDAASYLQGQCSQDVDAIAPGTAADTLVLSPQGKVDALARVVRLGPEEFVLDTDAGWGSALQVRLERFKLRVAVDLEPLAWRCLALRGPEAAGTAQRGAPGGEGEPIVAVPFVWGGVVGVDLLGPAPRMEPGTALCDDDGWEALRVEAGIPSMGAEIDERTIPAEIGLVERCVSFTKGCFTGQELVARLDARGSRVARRLRGLVVEDAGAPLLDADVLELVAGGEEAGRVTSVAWSYGLEAPVALALVRRRVAIGERVELRVRPGPRSTGPDPLVRQARVSELPLL
jgi:tRNA-modifying protein YgfZ